jgi:hypothetical protein
MDELVPDVLNSAPSRVLGVQFEGAVEVNLGNTLTIKDVCKEPKSISWDYDPEKFYTLCFTGLNLKNHSVMLKLKLLCGSVIQ